MRRMMIGCLGGRRILVKDSFDRADGAIGTAEIGGAWGVPLGSISIASNKAKGGTANVRNVAAIVTSDTNHTVSCDVTLYTDDIAFVIGRYNNSTNYMYVRIDTTTIKLESIIGGTISTIATYNNAWSNGSTNSIDFSYSGNDFIIKFNGSVVISTTSDNATKTYTGVGFASYKASSAPQALFDNFLATA